MPSLFLISFAHYILRAHAQGVNYTSAEACLRTKDLATLMAAQTASETDLIADLDHLIQVRGEGVGGMFW